MKMTMKLPAIAVPPALRTALPALTLALGLLALWLAWSGWRQMEDETRRAGATQARDAAALSVAKALRDPTQRLEQGLALPAVQAELRAGNWPAAARALQAGWNGVEEVAVLPADLDAAYAALPGTGYGRLALLQAAQAEGKSVAAVVKDGGKPKLGVAAPARVDGQVPALAYARLPATRVLSAIEGVDLGKDGYLALRQGGYDVAEHGDASLAEAAERGAVAVPQSGMRVVMAVPQSPGTAFGLGPIASLVGALLAGLLAFLAWRTWRAPGAAEAKEALPTLAESLEQVPPAAPEPTSVMAEPPPSKPTSVLIDRGIFRAYDIRGVVGQTLDAGVAELIGQSVGSLLAEQGLSDIVVGRDGRLSGPELVEGLTRGLRKAGRNVIDIGLAPTPLVYFGSYHLKTGCCIAVTGSHNPPDYNGFKIVVGGETLAGDAIVALHDRIAADRLLSTPEFGGHVGRDIGEDYLQRIAGDVQVDRRLKVVVDAGNGVAGELGPRVLEAIGVEVERLYCDIDGTFPNHHPDPSEPHNLADLVQMVKRMDADLGIAFDGDGDRLGVVTRDGENIFPDRLLMLFAEDVLERNPGAVILYDVKCSGRLPGHVLRHGGSPLMWKTGHSLIKAKMRETDAELAGEMSGHFFFGERWYGFDDGIYAAARLLEILGARAEEPGEVLAALPNGVSTPEIKVPAPGDNPHAFVARFQQAAHFEGARLSTLDGLRADFNDGWGLVRASNTTPVLVMRFDADDAEALARIQGQFRERLRALEPGLELPF